MKQDITDAFFWYYSSDAINYVIVGTAGIAWLFYLVNAIRYVRGMKKWLIRKNDSILLGFFGFLPCGWGTLVGYSFPILLIVLCAAALVRGLFSIAEAAERMRERSKERRNPDYQSEILRHYRKKKLRTPLREQK